LVRKRLDKFVGGEPGGNPCPEGTPDTPGLPYVSAQIERSLAFLIESKAVTVEARSN